MSDTTASQNTGTKQHQRCVSPSDQESGDPIGGKGATCESTDVAGVYDGENRLPLGGPSAYLPPITY